MSSQCLAINRRVAFMNSPKSHFGVVQMRKISCRCLASSGNIGFSISTKSLSRMVKRPKMNSVTCEPLKHRFLEFTQDVFWASQEEENEFP